MSGLRFLVVITLAVAVAVGAVVAAPAASAAVANLYVAPAGSDSNACTTTVEPCHTIGHAIALAATSGTTVHLATGHYTETVSPGSKAVTVVGAGTDHDTGSVIAAGIGATVVVNDDAGVLSLKSLAFGGDPIGAYVTAGTLTTSHTSLDQTSCAVFMTGGQTTMTDSRVYQSGIVGDSDCSPLTSSPVAVTVNGGSLSLVRSSLKDTKDEPGVVVDLGTFSARDSEFSDAAYLQSTNDATVEIAGGAATIERSLFDNDIVGLDLSGGSTSVTDSTFNYDEYGIVSAGGGHQPTVLRSTFVDAPLYGPAVLAGDVLTSRFGSACSEEPTDMGYNYGTRGDCQFDEPTSHNGIATLNLDALAADHGGPTATVAPSFPSALINTIPSGATWGPEHKKLCPAGTTDQRGVSRPQGGGCDVGAFEAAASHTVLTAAPDPAAPGAVVTLTATTTPHAGTFHDPDAVAGKVTFKTGTATLCTAKPVTSAGTASCATTALPAGTPSVTATFVSSSPYLGSAATAKPVVGTMPDFTSANSASVTVGISKTITVRATGTPKPTIRKASGTLPKGMRFTGGKGTATITGTPAAGTARMYVLHLRAANVRGRVNQTLTLTIRKP
jgi:hypothetical protein